MRSGEQLCSDIAKLLETATGEEFLKGLFWEILGYRPASDPAPSDVLPESLAPFITDAQIIGHWEGITILHVCFAASLPMATHEHEIMRRAGLVLPGTIGIFSNAAVTASDICYVRDDGTLSRIPLHSGLYNVNELATTLARLRTFDLETSQDVPALAALAEVEQAFSRLPMRSVETAAVRAERRLRANRSPLLAIIDSHPLLTAEEERSLALAWREKQDIAARNKLVYSNLRLAIWVVAFFPKHPMPFDDMLQQACRALTRAAEAFDPSKGFKFSTLAVFSMKRRIERERRVFGYPVYLPPHMQKELWEFRTNEPLPPAQGSPLSYRQKYQVGRQADQAYRPAISLSDTEDSSTERETELQEHREHVSWAMSFMQDARLRRIIELRFGLTGESEMTLEQVGEVFKVTRERIRQLEESALAELRLIMSAPPKPPASAEEPRTTTKWDWNDPKRNIGRKLKFKMSVDDSASDISKRRGGKRSKRRKQRPTEGNGFLWEDEGALAQTGAGYVSA